MKSLSFTAFLNDDPMRFMVGHHCDYVRIIKELKTGIVLAIRPGKLSSERLTLQKGKPVEFLVCNGHPVIVTYKQRKGDGFKLEFNATMWVKIYRPRFTGVE